VLFSEVAEHVAIVTIDVPTEDFDVVLGTELVDPHHQVSGAACQTHLREVNKHEQLEFWSESLLVKWLIAVVTSKCF